MPKYQPYYVPHQSKWPIIAAFGLFICAIGAVLCFHDKYFGNYILISGIIIIVYMMVGWFSNVIEENHQGLYGKQIDRTFRWGMFWFIFSEIMFFASFFGALFYMRNFSVPWLGGASNNVATNELLWPNFQANWPLLNNPDPKTFVNPKHAMKAWGLPAINTLVLITSSITITLAHHALLSTKKKLLNIWLIITVALGLSFLFLQGFEYYHAYSDLNLTLTSGGYGTTFFMLTGFHGLHVTIGTIMLIIMLLRALKNHFTPKNHFAFEATAWYWHFVDVIWLLLFCYVYILPLK